MAPQVYESTVQPPPEEDEQWIINQRVETIEWPDLERTASDEEDAPGEDALNKTEDRPKLKMHRSFELVFRNGQVVRFEVRLLTETSSYFLTSYFVIRHILADYRWSGYHDFESLFRTGTSGIALTLDSK